MNDPACRRCDQPKSAHQGPALVCPRQVFTFAYPTASFAPDKPEPTLNMVSPRTTTHLSPGATIGALIGGVLGGIVEIAAKESKPRTPCPKCGFTFSHSMDCPEHPKIKFAPMAPTLEETPRRKRLAKAKGKPEEEKKERDMTEHEKLKTLDGSGSRAGWKGSVMGPYEEHEQAKAESAILLRHLRAAMAAALESVHTKDIRGANAYVIGWLEAAAEMPRAESAEWELRVRKRMKP